LQLVVDGVQWAQQPSLLTALPDSQVFRVEIDDDGEATVVFGDGVFGQSLPNNAIITANYRVGGGQIGNLGADTLVVPYLDHPAPWLSSVTNPLAAVGGRNLESRDHARRVGPPLSQQPLVTVSSADYQTAVADFTDSDGQKPIQQAQASFQWTGSWLTVTLAVDPFGTEGLTPGLRQELLDYLGKKRLTGYDLEITGAIYLPVDLEIEFSVAPGFQPSNVEEALLTTLSNSVLPGGSKGFFHPDNFTFGQDLYVSKIYGAVMAVPGVQSAQITRLARQHTAQPDSETNANLAQGFLGVGPDQIIRLDNDRNFPERGSLTLLPKAGAV
jgi:predicted phage baseplate assembly protein